MMTIKAAAAVILSVVCFIWLLGWIISCAFNGAPIEPENE